MIELLRLRLVELRHEVAVAVERGLDRGVAQLRLDVPRVGPVGNQQAGVGMTEVVKADAAQRGSPERCRELPVPEVIGIERRAAFTTEDKLRPPGGRQLLKGLLKRLRHIDRTPRAPGLRRPERAAPERSPDVNLVPREVDVLPLQPKELTLTHPGEDGRQQ